ncbi:hypothetical protein NA57DRAFT_71201 [Rhizodiscina lignyota]|uniref:Uncharacterized protein n=1 Tax=Rhizodiscina lignyota TaxID=1504668 RepID=A0A9P4IP07_9PEZI|nr:hypothetical protein NA57DRAFT_71201 [Rhizodiscina lignyota]
MCQVCTLKTIAKRDRWPKPLEPHLEDVEALVNTAHSEFTQLKNAETNERRPETGKKPNQAFGAKSYQESAGIDGVDANLDRLVISDASTAQIRNSLIDTTRGLLYVVSVLEQERVSWWNSPAKQNQRRSLMDTFNAEKQKQLQVVNQKTANMVIDMRAKIGVFAKYVLIVELHELEGEERKKQQTSEKTV